MFQHLETFNFESFAETPTASQQQKIQYGLLLLKTEDRLPKKHVKFLRDGLFELRTEYEGNIFRVFFIFDEGRIVVLFNGFQKKSQKTPNSEIRKAAPHNQVVHFPHRERHDYAERGNILPHHLGTRP